MGDYNFNSGLRRFYQSEDTGQKHEKEKAQPCGSMEEKLSMQREHYKGLRKVNVGQFKAQQGG